MPDAPGTQLDRYLAGELSSPEQRELAQAALDDPELFDVLTTAAVMKTTAFRERDLQRPPVRSFKRSLVWLGIAGSAAAAIAFVIVNRSASRTVPAVLPTPSTTSTTSIKPAEDGYTIARPLILTARLDPPAGRSTAEFRADAAHSRPPKSHGVVVSVDDAEIGVDIGALDGVAKGSDLTLYRGDGDATVVGRLTIVTVFRERSRGRVSAGSPHVGDRVEVAPGVQVAALLEQVAALVAAGDTTAARTILERAVSISRMPDVPAEILNELGAVQIERGEYPDAEKTLRSAQTHATGTVAVRVANNLAALAALRRETVAAESMYRSALTLAGTSPELESDRRAILKNLESLKAPR